MDNIKAGMYVRCSIDLEFPNDPRRFAMGQVKKVDETFRRAIVKFWDNSNIIEYYSALKDSGEYYLNKLDRIKIIPNSIINYNGYKGIIRSFSHKNEKSYYVYYIEILDGNESHVEKIEESKIEVVLTQAEVCPISQLMNYELHNPRWYLMRRVVSKLMNIINNSSYGFEYLVGSRVHLLQHQVETVIRALNSEKCRFMLADEVGLGKTIEACAILKGLKNQTENFNSLLLIPSSLAIQWKNELYYKFNISVDIWDLSKPVGTDIIVPLELIEEAEEKAIFSYEWDICIVDETHNLLKDENKYKVVEKISNNFNHLLLLSATPVMERRTEYLKLLKLLKPDIYKNMTEEEFKVLLDKQLQIQDRVYPLIEDLEEYVQDNLYEEYLDDFEDIIDVLDDNVFEELVRNIDVESEDYGLKEVKLCLAYLGEYYQMERQVIRHRRQIIKHKMSKRTMETIVYEMSGSDKLFYEETVYETVKNLIQMIVSIGENINDREIIKELLNRTFSSPWALLELIDQIRSTNKYVSLRDEINSLRDVCLKWKDGVLREFSRSDELYDDPEKIQGRLLFILDYLLQQLDDTKIVVFSKYTSTLKAFEKLMESNFNKKDYTIFHKELNGKLLNENADKFQNDPKCRIIVCDELGGEGRNFQIADQIVHIDLPWSANALEQRIGRLDRLGRDTNKDVHSVVIYSKNTIEEELFKIWNEGLNIFNNSLSGLEIILGELNDLILESLCSNLNYGLVDAMEKIIQRTKDMRNQIKREEYFDIASQLNRDMENMLYRLIESFSENNGEALYKAMMSWSFMTGLHSNRIGNEIVSFNPQNFSIRSAENTLLIPPKWEKYKDYLENRRDYDIRGTFNRDLAINREDVLFFAPGDAVFDSIVDNAMYCDLGKSCAFQFKGDFYFKGLVLTWSVNPNINYILDLNKNLSNMSKFRGYLPLEQIVTVVPIDEASENVDSYKYKILEILDNYPDPEKIIHLGKRSTNSRGNSMIKQFKEIYPPEVWEEIINEGVKKSYKELKMHIKFNTNIKAAKEELDKTIDAHKVAQLFFNNINSDNTELEELHSSIYKGLNNPQVVLDSACYIWVVNSND